MAKTLNIALVFDDSLDRPDGVQQQISILAGWLIKQGHEVSLISGQTEAKTISGAKVYSLAKNFRISANKNHLSLPRPVRQRTIARLFDQKQFDIVHIMLPLSPWFGGRVAKEASKRGIALVGTFHTYPSDAWQRLGSRLYGRLYKRTLKRFRILTSVSEATKSSVEDLFGVNSEVIPNFIDLDRFKSVKLGKTSAPSIIFLNRLEERKGPQHLIEALGLLRKEHRLGKMKTVIAGKGPLIQYLMKRVEQLDLKNFVSLPGFIDESDKPSFLAQAELAVYPSTGGEAFGIVLLEAMAVGTLVLAGDNPGYRSVLGMQPKAMVDPTNARGFAERIAELIDDKVLAEQLRRQQSDLVRQYDVKTVGPEVLDRYTRALAL